MESPERVTFTLITNMQVCLWRLAMMNWASKKLYPELELFAVGRERRIALRRAGASWLYGSVLSVLFWFTLIAFFATKRHLLPHVYGWLGGSVFVWSFATALIFGAATGIIIQFMFRNFFRRELRRQLAGKGIPICIQCGYNLTALAQNRCPECGEEFGTAAIK